MSPSKDLQDPKCEMDSSLDSSSKHNMNDRHVTEKWRPPNAFLLYRSEKQSALRKRMNAPLPHDISRIVALWWREASPETKEYYRSLSNINAARYDPSQVVPTGKLSRTPRIPKAPKQQLLCMGHLRVTLPRYLKFVQEANDAIRLTCVPKYETLPSQSTMAFPPTPYKPYVPLVFPYRIQHIECHCHTCELPISSIATPIADDKVEEQDNDVDVGDIDTEVEVDVGVEVEEDEDEDEKDDDDVDDEDNSDDDNN